MLDKKTVEGVGLSRFLNPDNIDKKDPMSIEKRGGPDELEAAERYTPDPNAQKINDDIKNLGLYESHVENKDFSNSEAEEEAKSEDSLPKFTCKPGMIICYRKISHTYMTARF